jgi:DNA-binding response OmpR family regulator
MSRRVLIVDDNRALAENIGEILDAEGYLVDVAFNPESALALASDHAPDVAILDVRLPGMDGVSLFKKLSAMCPSATYVLMTAFTADERIADALAAGVRSVLPKPVPVGDLLDLLPSADAAAGRLIIVEDDDALARTLAEALGHQGYRTAIAGSLEGAHVEIAAGAVAGAVVDVRLPDGDGTVLARALCEQGIPTVLITGHEPSESVSLVTEQCAQSCRVLTKPFAPDTLLHTLRSLDALDAP